MDTGGHMSVPVGVCVWVLRLVLEVYNVESSTPRVRKTLLSFCSNTKVSHDLGLVIWDCFWGVRTTEHLVRVVPPSGKKKRQINESRQKR